METRQEGGTRSESRVGVRVYNGVGLCVASFHGVRCAKDWRVARSS